MTNTKPATANEMMDEAAAEPTLDEFMRRDPSTHTDDDRRVAITIHRRNRAAFIKAGEKRKAKREGVDDD